MKAFADYIINFNFGKGIQFHTPEATSAIIPYLLKRVWDEDNRRNELMWEIGQYGTVSGDVFVKVAYEDPFVDPTGQPVAGKIRILPLNPAFCFPTWHPHDKTRLVEFKLKYKFFNTAPDGTKTVSTYVEVLTEQSIREYINDELLDERPNPLGTIPIAFCPNILVASSPWGLGDVQELVGLNREYNEKASEISEIIHYYAAPVTVITGGKASNLERGSKKIWALPQQGAEVKTLEMETNLQGPLGYMELLKQSMHELTGVPAQALGTMQPISNTAGVAIHMQYQPMMQKHNQKKILYTPLFKRINELIIKYAVLYEPEWLQYNPEVAATYLEPTQYQVCDPYDPVTYRTSVEWTDPLPMDVLLKINEIQAKMALGLESKAGALRELGEHFPLQKLQEISEELMEDTKDQGAMALIQAQINQFIVQSTGMAPDGTPLIIPGEQQTDAEGNPTGMAPAINPEIAQEVMMKAYEQMPPERMDFDEEPR